jgi:hypothetical protein
MADSKIKDCKGFGLFYKDEDGNYCSVEYNCPCKKCLRFNPEAEKRLIDFIGWDNEGPCEFKKL